MENKYNLSGVKQGIKVQSSKYFKKFPKFKLEGLEKKWSGGLIVKLSKIYGKLSISFEDRV